MTSSKTRGLSVLFSQGNLSSRSISLSIPFRFVGFLCGIRGLYSVSAEFVIPSTLRHMINSHCPVSRNTVLLPYSMGAFICLSRTRRSHPHIGEPSVTKLEESHGHVGCPGVRGQLPPQPWNHSSRHQIGECDGEERWSSWQYYIGNVRIYRCSVTQTNERPLRI